MSRHPVLVGVASRMSALAALAILASAVYVAVLNRPISPSLAGDAQADGSPELSGVEWCSAATFASGVPMTLVEPAAAIDVGKTALVEADALARYPGASVTDRVVAGVVGDGAPLLNGKTVILVELAGRQRPGIDDGEKSTVACTIVVYDADTLQWEMTFGRTLQSE